MTKQTLSAIENLAAANTRMVESYNAAAKTLATAYCKGVQGALARAAARRSALRAGKPSMLSEQAREQWLQTSAKWNDMVQQRLEAGTNSAITVMDRVAVAATSGIDAATQRVVMIDSPAVRQFVDGVVALQLPVAQLSAQLADKVAAGAQRLEERAEAFVAKVEQVQADVVDVVAKPAKRPAARRNTRKAA
ncbi:hypothetical protein [Ottowia sp.]|uniref:hypothetical protein n=1 Tax=Ottowia sp. TaxID=1898956 RepID=UPI0039482CEE